VLLFMAPFSVVQHNAISAGGGWKGLPIKPGEKNKNKK